MKESYIKLPNITVSKLQDVVDYLDENNIKYIEDYKEEVELNKYKIVLDKIKEYIKNLLKEEFEITDPDNINYGEKCQRAYFSDSELIKILELLEEIE